MTKIHKKIGQQNKRRMAGEVRRLNTLALYSMARQEKIEAIEKELIRLGYCK